MKQMRFPGLSGSAIKYTGLVMMVFDHLYQMFAAQGSPQWFHWIGRPVLPLFLFLCAEAFWYTRSRTKYMMRLLIGFELMHLGNWALSNLLPVYNLVLDNNVFQTLFLATFYMLCIEILRAGKTVKAAVLMLLPIATSSLFLLPFPHWLKPFYFFIPNLLITEGGLSAVMLAILFYLFREKRLVRILIIAPFGILSIIITFLRDASLFSGSAQWLLFFAVIPIWLYNGERGRSNRYFFYIFYPAHIYLLYIVASDL